MHIPLASAQRVALFKSLARFRKRGISDLRWGPSGIAVGDFIQAADAGARATARGPYWTGVPVFQGKLARSARLWRRMAAWLAT